MSNKKKPDDGTETDHEVTVKVQHYIPSAGRGRMHMSMGQAEFSDKRLGVKGSIYMPIGSASPVVTVERIDGEAFGDVFTFDARGLIDAAVKVFLETHGPACATCGQWRDHANHEAPPDGKRMGERHAFALP